MLTDITAPGLTTSYGYDFNGRRTGKVVDSVDTVYRYAGWDLLVESTPAQTAEYLIGADIDEILHMRVANADYFYYLDAVGSVRQIYDDEGRLANSYSYGAWGEARRLSVAILNSLSFTGREVGEDSLSGYRLRYDNPGLGRFVSEDPLRLAAGDPNMYRYVFNNPANLVDPSGGLAWLIPVAAVGVALLLDPEVVNAPGPAEPTYKSDTGKVLGNSMIGALVGLLVGLVADPPMPAPDSLDPCPEEPLPPGWNEDWELEWGSRDKSKARHWWDENGGEWRWHGPDEYHPQGHWDYNPWRTWSDEWTNVPHVPGAPGARR